MLPTAAWRQAVAIGDLLPRLRYAIAYGSHATGAARPDSDLDLLFVTQEPATPRQASEVTSAVIDLHRDYGLQLDTEVAFDVKLIASRTDVAVALSLGGFVADGALAVPPVDASPTWLNSAQFRLRLILGALTSTHVFLTGDLRAYLADQARTDSAIATLAAHMLRDNLDIGLADVTTALLEHPSGATGKDHLGYRQSPHLIALALRAVAHLEKLGCLRSDGVRWRIDHARVTQQVNTILAAYPD